MKVWILGELRVAWTASQQRSMSLKFARARPQMVLFLASLRDLGHGGEVAFAGDGEAGLDDVDPHLVEEGGDLQLFLVGHGRAGGSARRRGG